MAEETGRLGGKGDEHRALRRQQGGDGRVHHSITLLASEAFSMEVGGSYHKRKCTAMEVELLFVGGSFHGTGK